MHTAYGFYAATGEGYTVWMAIANTPEAAVKLFKEKVNPYFHRCMEDCAYEDLDEHWLERLSPFVRSKVENQPHAYYQYFQEFHYNFS